MESDDPLDDIEGTLDRILDRIERNLNRTTDRVLKRLSNVGYRISNGDYTYANYSFKGFIRGTTIYCEVEDCRFNEDGICKRNQIEINKRGFCRYYSPKRSLD